MKKTFYLPVSEETCNYLQRLGMEVDARKEIINHLFTSHANDVDGSVLTSKPFETYQKQYNEVFAEYNMAKEALGKELQPLVDKEEGGKEIPFNWLIEDFSGHKVKIEVLGE